MAASLDYKRELKQLYAPSGRTFGIVDVPALQFLMIDGHGDPNTSTTYAQAVEALYALAYGIRSALKNEGYVFAVMPLEGLWWSADMAAFGSGNKDAWDWTMMIMQPERVTQAVFEAARAQVAAKKKGLVALDQIRLERYAEGLAVQILYTGPYAEEHETIAAMHAHAMAQGYRLGGKHHEIYLSDPRRTDPAKLKTVLRQPIVR